MLNELGRTELSKLLHRTFGKDTFTEDELTKDFYTNLYIGSGDFFKTEDGCMDLDFFWSEDVREYLLEDKTRR